jgi:hypothetical protein
MKKEKDFCGFCKKPFISNTQNRKYCSDLCFELNAKEYQKKYQKEYRENPKRVRRNKDKKLSPEEAKKLQQKLINKWNLPVEVV